MADETTTTTDKKKKKARKKKEAGNLQVRYERPKKATDATPTRVVLSFMDGERARKFVLGSIAPCKVDTPLGELDAFAFEPAESGAFAGPALETTQRKTLGEVKRDVNKALFDALVGPPVSKAAEAAAAAS